MAGLGDQLELVVMGPMLFICFFFFLVYKQYWNGGEWRICTRDLRCKGKPSSKIGAAQRVAPFDSKSCLTLDTKSG